MYRQYLSACQLSEGEMSVPVKRTRELVNSYGQSLELRIDRGDSSLVCGDEDLWKQVEGLLADGNAHDTHSLGLDPLKVMEESLTTAALSPQDTEGRVRRARGGLRGLAKAFEVLELAALNLYLGPWRKEYEVVKMYSGMFTHYIKPVLSMPQILELFGLLGYQPCSGRYEQLRLQSVSFYSLDNLLHLACAFFLARCECRLLLSALGKHTSQADWELSLVRERHRGHSVQVALDNTEGKLEAKQPLKEDPLELSGIEDGDLDLYTDEEVNNGLKKMTVDDGEGPRPLSWVGRNSASSPPAAVAHINGLASLSSSSTTSSSPREPVCVSTFNYQLTKTSPGGASSSRNITATTRQSRSPYEESSKQGHDGENLQSRGPTAQASGFRKRELSSSEDSHICSCVKSHCVYLQHCIDCNVLHSVTCALHDKCLKEGHNMVFADDTTGKVGESKAVSPQRILSDRGMSALSPDVKGNTTLSSSLLHDASSPQPIPYHDCCDPAHPDPQFICVSCWVFHSGACRGVEFCKKQHEVLQLGVCSCGKECSRNPLVLCRYCGTEYCNQCWYRRPLACGCGRTFDQSSAV